MGQVVVITGAGGGLGSIFARELAGDGRLVAVLDYDKGAAEQVAEEIKEHGGTAEAIRCNVVDKASMERARGEVREKLGKCNVLINCAGIQDPLAKTTSESYHPGEENDTEAVKADPLAVDSKAAVRDVLGGSRTLFNIDAERMLRVMNVNWLGTVIASQVFAVDLVGGEGNSIINITSMAAYDALSMVPAYASSKAAVDMFTKWLSNYLSNEYGKVRVNAVAPGYFLTPLNHDMYVNPDGSHTQRYYNVIHRTPMGRLGNPKELVGALRFFADPGMSGYVTGQVIAVDGGFLSCPGI